MSYQVEVYNSETAWSEEHELSDGSFFLVTTGEAEIDGMIIHGNGTVQITLKNVDVNALKIMRELP